MSRGLVMSRSLEKVCPSFTLYVVAFDDITYNYFKDNPEKNLKIISLDEFEDPELLKIKPTRSVGEYCWTCSSSTILYCIEKYNLDHCVYIDADMVFYNDPHVLFEEWGSRSVLITKHRYTEEYDQSALSGIYCVQFVGFKNDAEGMKAIHWWRNACLEWCYDRLEEGKFGDQKYLDDWTTRFKNVCELRHIGGGVAPWNVQQYQVIKRGANVSVKEIATKNIVDLVFYHYHGLKFFVNGTVILSDYKIQNKGVLDLYMDYVKELLEAGKELSQTLPGVNINAASNNPPFLPLNGRERLKNGLKKILGKTIYHSVARQNMFYLHDITG
ncbi:MAG: glycosyl transferase [Bacteroidetes bacterium]|nr:glycosyl transferase [Bacteroidota bacterium]